MKKTIKNKVVNLESHEEFEYTCNAIAELEVKIRKASAAQDEDLRRVREKHEDKLQPLIAQMSELTAQASSYASIHKEDLLPAGRKSGETSQATWGYRLDPPALKTMPKVTWALVIDRMRKGGLAEFITLPAPKPDKDRMKTQLTDQQLAELGVVIKSTEHFFVKAKDRTESV